MIILGIDPGFDRVGWAIIEKQKSTITPHSFGSITTDKKDEHAARLLTVYTDLAHLFKKYSPDVMALEDLFFSKNVKTALSVAEARGVILMTSMQFKTPTYSYSPNRVKLALTGWGKADKSQVSKMVVQLLKLKVTPKLDDTVDALAIALTHAYDSGTHR